MIFPRLGMSSNNRPIDTHLISRSLIEQHLRSLAMTGPFASLHPLTRTDGSASYQCPSTGFNILGSANAPIELPGRRDALKPEDTTVEVFVKPGTGQSGVGEQYVKEIIKNLLGKVVLGRERGYPRRGVVVTLAVIGGESVGRGDSVSFGLVNYNYELVC